MRKAVILAVAALLAGCQEQHLTGQAWPSCALEGRPCTPEETKNLEYKYDKECDPLLCSVPRSPLCPRGKFKHRICQSSNAEALPWKAGDRVYRMTWDETFGGMASYILRIRADGSATIQYNTSTKPKRVPAAEAVAVEAALRQTKFFEMGEEAGGYDCFDGTDLTVEAQTPEGYHAVVVSCADSHRELHEPWRALFNLAHSNGLTD